MLSIHRLLLLVAVAATTLIVSQAASAGVLYAPHYGDETVQAYATSNGVGTALPGSPFSFIGPPNAEGLMGFGTSPDGLKGASVFLFAGGFQGVSIAPDGSLAAAQPTAAGAEATSLAISPTTSRVYVPTRTLGNGIRIYDFDANGAMQEIPASPAAAGDPRYDVAITPDGRFLYATSNANGLEMFSISADGGLTPNGAVGPNGVFRLQTSPDGRFLFALNATTFAIQSYAIGADGILTPIEAEGLGGFTDSSFTISPDGRFLFVPVTNLDTVKVFAVAPDGSMSPLGQSPLRDQAETVTTSVDGRFLFAGDNAGLGGIYSSPIGADGSLGAWTPIDAWNVSTAPRISFRTAQAPTAKIATPTRVAPGVAASFNASETSIALGTLGRFEWDFGDGTVVADGGPTPTHTFANAGVYDVTVKAHDSDGCSTQRIHTGQTTLCNGAPTAAATLKFDTLPAISRLKVSPKRFKRKWSKARITYRLTERARVTFTVQRPTRGRKVGKSCRKETRKNRRRGKCVRWVRVGKTVTKNGRAGRNTFKFKGKAGRTVLRRGKYRVAVYATDSARGKSTTRTARFRVR